MATDITMAIQIGTLHKCVVQSGNNVLTKYSDGVVCISLSKFLVIRFNQLFPHGITIPKLFKNELVCTC